MNRGCGWRWLGVRLISDYYTNAMGTNWGRVNPPSLFIVLRLLLLFLLLQTTSTPTTSQPDRHMEHNFQLSQPLLHFPWLHVGLGGEGHGLLAGWYADNYNYTTGPDDVTELRRHFWGWTSVCCQQKPNTLRSTNSDSPINQLISLSPNGRGGGRSKRERQWPGIN